MSNVNSNKSEDGDNVGDRGKYDRVRRKHSKEEKEHRKTEDMPDSLLMSNHVHKNKQEKGNHEGRNTPEKQSRERRKSKSGSE